MSAELNDLDWVRARMEAYMKGSNLSRKPGDGGETWSRVDMAEWITLDAFDEATELQERQTYSACSLAGWPSGAHDEPDLGKYVDAIFAGAAKDLGVPEHVVRGRGSPLLSKSPTSDDRAIEALARKLDAQITRDLEALMRDYRDVTEPIQSAGGWWDSRVAEGFKSIGKALESPVLAAGRIVSTYSPVKVKLTFGGVKDPDGIATSGTLTFGKVDELTLDSPLVVSALGAINKHRALCAQRPLNPRKPIGQVQPWTAEDVLEYARDPAVGWVES